MTRNIRTSDSVRTVAALALTVTLFAAPASMVVAQSEDPGKQPSLVGTWAVLVTLRDCTTSAPLGPPINSLVTFHHDGTLSETAGGLTFAPGQRSPGHGSWTRKREHTYRQEMIALILFDTPPNLPGTPTFDPTRPVSPGFFAGWVTVTHTVRFTDADHIASAGTNGFHNTSGELYRSGCSTATAQRF
jgi:hypothetical protein